MQLGIREKLLVVLILPLLVLSGFAVSSIVASHGRWRDAMATEKTVTLAVKAGAAAHHLQVERGATAGYIQSGGQRFGDVLPAYREKTDATVRVAALAFADLAGDSSVTRDLNAAAQAARQALEKLPANRAGADALSIAATESSVYYTRTIAALLATVDVSTSALTDGSAATRLSALEMLLHAKEFAGQERATMMPIVTLDAIERTQYRAFNETIGRQSAYIAAFFALAEAGHVEAWRDTVAGQPESDLVALRNVLHASDKRFGIRPETWFAVTTARIDAMLKVEQRVSGDLLVFAGEHAARARLSLIVASVAGAFAIVLTLVLGIAIIRSIIRPLAHLQAVIARVEHSGDFSLRVGAISEDEVGRTAVAFDRMMARIASLMALVETRSAELAHARDIAETASKAKSEFLSRMSHELRTPLNAILGFAQVLAMSGKATLTEEQAEDVQEILKAGHHLLDQVNEVLDLSRIESGHIDLNIKPLPAAPLIKDCIAQVMPLASARGIAVIMAPGDVMDRARDPTLTLMGDAIRVKQVMLNLLSNAIKYNRDGGQVYVSVMAEGDRMRVEVRDTGRGIAPEKWDRLFKPFERLESSYDGIEGAGIGLALVKRLVEAMGGEIGMESKVAVGSTFWFALPLPTPST